MTDKGKKDNKVQHAAKVSDGKQSEPEWATGLKQLYDSVVDEPLPDNLKDLLSQLDDEDED